MREETFREILSNACGISSDRSAPITVHLSNGTKVSAPERETRLHEGVLRMHQPLSTFNHVSTGGYTTFVPVSEIVAVDIVDDMG